MELKSCLKNLPISPGVYKFFDEKERVIYVGKAKNLKKRVKNYFQKSTKHSPKNLKLLENTKGLEWVETNTEQEALILETNFIKELRPKYNILMKDDKNFVYIKITLNEDYPRVLIVRKMEKDGAKYFGPKTSKTLVQKTLKTLTKIFPFRDCNYQIEGEGENVKVKGSARNLPCLQYHIKKCLGPCIGKISKKDYREIINQIIFFLKGNTTELEKHLKAQMQKLALEKKFERAAKLRDNLFAVQNIASKQIISEANFEERDVFGFVQDLGKTFFTLLQIRDGKMIGQENFVVESEEMEKEDISVILLEFLKQYYSSTTDIPKEILLPQSLLFSDGVEQRYGDPSQGEQKPTNNGLRLTNNKNENSGLDSRVKPENDIKEIKTFLSDLAGKAVKLFVPQKGKKNALVQLAEKNAKSYSRTFRLKWMEERQINYEKLLGELQEKLKLKQKIRRMECYDISHLGGIDTVGSMVVFQNGKPKNSDYRHFKLRSLEEGEIDDFKAMKEVLERRLNYLAFDDKKKLLGENYKLRKGKKSDAEFIEKTASKAKLDVINFDIKEFLVLEKNVKPVPLEGDTGGVKPQGKQKTTQSSLVKNNPKTDSCLCRNDIKECRNDRDKKDQKQIVGFVRIKNYNEKVKEIGTLWVDKKERQKGFGTLLCSEIVRRSKLAKVYAIGRANSLRFYFKVGFQEIYDLPKEISERITQRGLKKEDYKHFAYIKSRQAHIDKSFSSKPHLIVIDGGKGQLSVVQKIMQESKLDIPMISLAKKEEEIFIPRKSNPIKIDSKSEISFLIQRLRDESHRFANAFNRELRSKRMITSRLDEIIGIGPKMKQKLIQRFGSVQGIKKAGDGELIGVVGKGMMQKLRQEL